MTRTTDIPIVANFHISLQNNYNKVSNFLSVSDSIIDLKL